MPREKATLRLTPRRSPGARVEGSSRVGIDPTMIHWIIPLCGIAGTAASDVPMARWAGNCRHYLPKSFFIRSMTSGGCVMTSLANASSSSPLVGSISIFCFSA